ncbi:hypothetical protein H9L39_20030 [Fusarium oxysporum f. sp. albedinis]|nr:hypothetical protein H9L39_20030 [Fusarium oxysporum f. sp. albedinis]
MTGIISKPAAYQGDSMAGFTAYHSQHKPKMELGPVITSPTYVLGKDWLQQPHFFVLQAVFGLGPDGDFDAVNRVWKMMFTLGTAFYPRLEDFDQERRPILANYQPSLKQPRRTSVSEPTAQAVIAPPSSFQVVDPAIHFADPGLTDSAKLSIHARAMEQLAGQIDADK